MILTQTKGDSIIYTKTTKCKSILPKQTTKPKYEGTRRKQQKNRQENADNKDQTSTNTNTHNPTPHQNAGRLASPEQATKQNV